MMDNSTIISSDQSLNIGSDMSLEELIDFIESAILICPEKGEYFRGMRTGLKLAIKHVKERRAF